MNRRKEEFSMSRQEIKKNYNEAEEKTLIYHRKYKRKRPDIWIIYTWLMEIS